MIFDWFGGKNGSLMNALDFPCTASSFDATKNINLGFSEVSFWSTKWKNEAFT